MRKKVIAVLFGGCSDEYDVSLQSASSIIKNIDSEKYKIIMIGITRQGEWKRYDGGIQEIQNGSWMNHASCVPAIISPDRKTRGIVVFEGGRIETVRIDMAFPVLHGRNGEDGRVQGLLEMAGISYVGSGMLSSAMCMDKDIAHRLVSHAEIKTPSSMIIDTELSDEELEKRVRALKYPLFVKPVNGGSSIGITRVSNRCELKDAVRVALLHDRKVLIEEGVDGFEVGCAILNNGSPVIGEVDEIELSRGFFDNTEKYTLKTSRIHVPARIDTDTADRIKETAVKIYKILGCKGYARVDMFLTKGGEIVFNEVNTIPGFTSHSRYPNMLKGIGMTFSQIVDELIRSATQE
jgi:D-alanine---D-serine ligase